MKKILVVDDSDTVRTQLRRDLEAAGFAVIEGVDGIDGLEKAKADKPDFILCDLNMPRLDGLSMVGQVRAEASLKETPVFMLTTEASAEMKQRAKELGVKAWITKPYDAAKLILGIKKVLGLS